MWARLTLTMLLVLAATAQSAGQTMPGSPERVAPPALRWNSDGADRAGILPTVHTATLVPSGSSAPAPPGQTPPLRVASEKGSATAIADKSALPSTAARRPVARVTNGNGTLPNEKGQVWREYDIGSYTMRVTSTERPEQALVDWILRETGYEAWHAEPLGILSATRQTLRVYHTPAMQVVVADLVDRFVSSEAATSTFALHVITVDQPNWRTVDQRLLRPVTVQTPGAMAWLLEKEDAAVLLGNLQRRSDYREHSSPHLLVNNGQATVVSAKRARPYIRNVAPRGDLPMGYETQMGQIDEGFSLDFSPLLSIDRKLIDATLKCEIDQVEKLISVILEAPTPAAPRQRTRIEVPQMVQFRFHERFRWPVEQVLLIDMGMAALPVPVDGKPTVGGIPLPFGSVPARADLLVLVECKGDAREAPRMTRDPQREAKSYRGRY